MEVEVRKQQVNPASRILAGNQDPFANVRRIKLHNLEVAEVAITPALAALWLGLNRNFRALSEHRASMLAGQMKAGWDVNGETVKFARKGDQWVLVDGQHRLRGCVLSGHSFESLVVWGVDSDLAVDVGAIRQLADILHSRGEKNANALAAAIRWIWKWENGKFRSAGLEAQTSHAVLLDVLARHPDIRHSVAVGAATKEILPLSMAIFLHYAFSLVDGLAASKFFDALSTGVNLERDDPIFILRRRLLKDKDSTKLKLRAVEKLALAIKTWNLWVAGRSASTSSIRWRSVGPAVEPFPEIEGTKS